MIVVPLSSWQGTTTRHEVGNNSRQDVTSQKTRLSISIAVRKLVSIFHDSYDINLSLCCKVCLGTSVWHCTRHFHQRSGLPDFYKV